MKRALSIIGAGALALGLSAGILDSSAGAAVHQEARVTSSCRLAIEGYKLVSTLLSEYVSDSIGYVDEIGPAAQAGEDDSSTELSIVTAKVTSITAKVKVLEKQLLKIEPYVKQDAANCLAGK